MGKKKKEEKQQRTEDQPVVREDVVPRRLVEPAPRRINSFHERRIVYRDLLGPNTDDGAVLEVCFVDRAVALARKRLAEDPERGERGGRVCGGDIAERRGEVPVDHVQDIKREERDYQYRQHLGLAGRTRNNYYYFTAEGEGQLLNGTSVVDKVSSASPWLCAEMERRRAWMEGRGWVVRREEG